MAPRWEWSQARRGELIVLLEIRRCSYKKRNDRVSTKRVLRRENNMEVGAMIKGV